MIRQHMAGGVNKLARSRQRGPAPPDEGAVIAARNEADLDAVGLVVDAEPGLPGDALYIILSGEVVIYAENGEEVAHLGAGDSFGEISLLLNTVHRRRAIAVGDCELLVLPKQAFMAMLRTNQRLAEHFDSVLHTRFPEPVPDLSKAEA